MASEREEALREVIRVDDNSANKLDEVLKDAALKRLSLEQAHALQMRRAEMGIFGRLLGDQAHAPLVIAFLMLLFSLLTASLLWTFAYRSGKTEFWSGEAHIAFGGALTALGYIFGKGSSRGRRD